MILYATNPRTIENTAIAVDSDPKVASMTEIEKKILLYSQKYNVPYQRLYNTIDCETDHTFDTKIQSQVKYNFSAPVRGIVKGEQEKSFGLAQIHLPDHPNVSYSQAIDADFAIEFMAQHYSKGKDIWFCD